MLDIALLRRDLSQVIARLQTRKNPQVFLNESAFTTLENERKTLQTRTEELQAKRNSLSKQIGQLKAKGEAADAVMAEVGQLKDELDASAVRLDALQTELQSLLLAVPNLPQEGVPVGADEHGNVELRRWSPTGTEPAPLGFTAKDHVELGGGVKIHTRCFVCQVSRRARPPARTVPFAEPSLKALAFGHAASWAWGCPDMPNRARRQAGTHVRRQVLLRGPLLRKEGGDVRSLQQGGTIPWLPLGRMHFLRPACSQVSCAS